MMKTYLQIQKTLLGGLFALCLSLLLVVTARSQSTTNNPDSPEDTSVTIYLPIVRYEPPPAPPPSEPPGEPQTYYISPTGNDNRSGKSEGTAWATFDHAWKYLFPGDTLILLDGTYYQSLAPNVRNGQPGNPITIKAKNDGKAIIDGQFQRATFSLKFKLNKYSIGDWYVIEGIVARNSSEAVYKILGDHNILRRVSGYNGNNDDNSAVFILSRGSYNLIEDCIAAGSGRKMVVAWGGTHQVIRRCFANWIQFDGREHCSEWPWGNDLEFYNSSDGIIESSISYGSSPNTAVSVIGNVDSANGDQPYARDNKILGVMSIRNGVFPDGRIEEWGFTRPQPTECNNIAMLDNWKNWREGFGVSVWGPNAEVRNINYQDIFSWGNSGLGFAEAHPYNRSTNMKMNRATITNNGLDIPGVSGPIGTEVVLEDISHYSITNSFIDGTQYQGEGARLEHRYVDGELMDGSNGKGAQPLWPWPMQDRILTELGIDVTGELTQILMSAGVPTGVNLPAPDISPAPPRGDIVNSRGVVSFFEPTQVTLTTPTGGAVIRYTTDGSEPSSSSAVYNAPIMISSTTILKAKAFLNGQESHSRSAYYKINTNLQNEPPVVEAKLLPFAYPKAEIMLPTDQIELYGTAQDHSFPSGNSQLNTSWSVHDGPAGVTFDDPSALRTTATFPQSGVYVLRLTASDGHLSAFADATVIVLPYGGWTFNIPGRIEAEDYKGGDGIGYYDTDGVNKLYRYDNVDLITAYNEFYGYSVSHIFPGEWLAYDVNIIQSGVYQVNARVAGAREGGVFHLELDGSNISGPITVPFTQAGFGRYTTVTFQTPYLGSGTHELRIVADKNAPGEDRLFAAINYIEFVK